jgi:hypothetical protein
MKIKSSIEVASRCNRVAAGVALLPIAFKASAVSGLSNLEQKVKKSSCNNCTKTF